MPQYRLTKKFSEDCKISIASLPSEVDSAIDDWVIDLFKIDRYKIVIATHVKTLCTLLIPSSYVDKPVQALELLPKLFAQFLIMCGYEDIQAAEAYMHLCNLPVQYCKTHDRSVLGVMNDFKRCAKYYLEGTPFADIDWGEVVMYLNQIPVNLKCKGFFTPRELLDSLLIKPQLLH
jgi:hypothetical protein